MGTIHRLSSLGVARLKKPGHYSDSGGLYLQVSMARTRSWVYRFRRKGRLRERLLPRYRKMAFEGIDLIEARRAERTLQRAIAARSRTFDECSKAFIKANRAGWKNEKHSVQWENTLATYASPVIGPPPARDIDTALVVRVLADLAGKARNSQPCARAHRVGTRLGDGAQGYHEGENPARWKGHLDKIFPVRTKVWKVRHYTALPYAQAAAFMKALRAQEGLAARALELLVLTAARTNEVIGAIRGEFDLDAATWTVPAERMKIGRPHRIPLSEPALALVRGLLDKAEGDLVFPGAKKGRSLSNMAMLTVLRWMKIADVTVQGFRSTFYDWAAECTRYPNEMAEMVLAHTVDDKVEAAYRRGDMFRRRRQMMDDWSAHCAGSA